MARFIGCASFDSTRRSARAPFLATALLLAGLAGAAQGPGPVAAAADGHASVRFAGGGLVPMAPAATITVDGTCTLADAITAANTDTATGSCPAGSGADTIELAVDVTLTSALPTITSQIILNGNGHTIARDATASEFRILDLFYANLTVNQATITGGRITGGGLAGCGGGIRNIASTLTVNYSTISSNTASVCGGIANGCGSSLGGTVTINNSTISNNVTSSQGAAVSNDGGTVTINNSTISGNSSGSTGTIDVDCFYGASTLTINNSTVSGNTGPVGGVSLGPTCHATIDSSTITNNSARGLFVDGSFSTATVRNSIIAGQTSGPDCQAVSGGVINSNGHNISSDATCGFTGTGDQQNVSAASLKLGPLANNGGPTWTHALLPGSPAIDAGDTTLTTDQRGIARPQGAVDDIGAYEFSCPAFPVSVATEAELNVAIFCYNGKTVPDSYTINVTQNIDLTASTTTINNVKSGVKLVIEGSGHAVDGHDILGVRPFTIEAGATVTIMNMTITRGKVGPGDAGGGIFNRGTLTVLSSTISHNQANTGGGISNEGGVLTVVNSTVSSNHAGTWGGGIDTGGTLTVINSTISDNNTSFKAGGIEVESTGALALRNSIVANNTSPIDADCSPVGAATAQNSLVETGTPGSGCLIGANNLNGDPNLGALQNNGGPTETHELLSGSIAINAGANALADDPDGNPLTTDQRGTGFPRIVAGTVDMGAYEAVAVAVGTIVISKSTAPAGGTGFNFTDNIAVPNSFTLDDGQNHTFTDIPTGTYTVTESAPVGGRLTGLVCDDDTSPTPSTGNLTTRTATVNLDPGETVTCHFTNSQDDLIVIQKVTNPAGGTGFDFSGSLGAFTLDDGELLVASAIPGTYTVTEADPGADYDVTEVLCWVFPAPDGGERQYRHSQRHLQHDRPRPGRLLRLHQHPAHQDHDCQGSRSTGRHRLRLHARRGRLGHLHPGRCRARRQRRDREQRDLQPAAG
jgi:hypothetical protein